MKTRSSSPPSLSPALALAVTALLGAACADNIKTDFPAGLDPVVAVNPAPCPTTQTDLYPENTLGFASDTSGSIIKVYACAYIKRPVADVWAAGKVPQTASEPKTGVSGCGITLDVETGYDASWRFHNTYTKGITIEFDVTWRSGTLPWPTPDGGAANPPTVAWRFKKTFGSAYIQTLEGSVVAYEVPGVVPAVTKLEFIRYVEAPTDLAAVQGGVQNHYDNIMAQLAAVPPVPPVYTNRICTGP